MSEAHDRVERLAGAIYGTIVLAGVLASSEYDDQPEALDADETAIDIAFRVCVASPGAWGAIVAHRERASAARTLSTAMGCALLGLVLVGLKELVS